MSTEKLQGANIILLSAGKSKYLHEAMKRDFTFMACLICFDPLTLKLLNKRRIRNIHKLLSHNIDAAFITSVRDSPTYVHIVTYLRVCDYRRGIDWWMDLLTTYIHHSELHFTDHWHTQTNVLSLLQSTLAVSWQWLLPSGDSSAPALWSSSSQLTVHNCCQVTSQLTGSQAGSHCTPTSWSSLHRLTFNWTDDWTLTHQPATSRHFTQLNCWQL
jgi:hypothetical protein